MENMQYPKLIIHTESSIKSARLLLYQIISIPFSFT